jgi:hypothetical protein
MSIAYAVVLVGDSSTRHLAERREIPGTNGQRWAWWPLCGAHIRRRPQSRRVGRRVVEAQQGQTLANVTCGLCNKIKDNPATGANRFIPQFFLSNPWPMP